MCPRCVPGVCVSYGDVQQRFGVFLLDVVSVQRNLLDLPALSKQQVRSRGDGANIRPRRRTNGRGRSHHLVNTCTELQKVIDPSSMSVQLQRSSAHSHRGTLPGAVRVLGTSCPSASTHQHWLMLT